ncbi:MAG: glycoside hydrolase family 92 protein, partial [Flavobacteriales bacterium]|nr:glycoside hydrolase family 92 protein [Flavobacteriales bacterium]
MKKYFYLLLILLIACNAEQKDSTKNYISYVNPMVGTKNMGHTFPGATTPFGMVQLSPTTNIQPLFKDKKYNKETYRYC